MTVNPIQGKTKYWIGVASRDHVIKGVQGGFAQLCHGKKIPLKKMSTGDWLIYYSSKKSLKENKPYQKFTAIGRVVDPNIYQVKINDDFMPYRRNIDFIHCKEVSIHPLISELSFIENERYWGYPFRFGHLEICAEDFKLISTQMKVT